MWTDHENMRLHGGSEPQKASYCMIPFYTKCSDGQIHRDKVDRWLPGAGVGGGEQLLSGYGVSFWRDENVL